MNQKLQFMHLPQGYINVLEGHKPPQERVYDYIYQYKDHLEDGALKNSPVDCFSERARRRARGQSFAFDRDRHEIRTLTEHNYYPFGLEHSYLQTRRHPELVDEPIGEININSDSNTRSTRMVQVDDVRYQYKYNGKEWQDEMGLNFYDYHARNYDPALGRWMNVDALAEKYYSESPFVYAVNNPMFFIEPDGNQIDISAALEYDKTNKTDFVSKIISDLTEQTGLTYEIKDGKLEYKKDIDGNAVISKDKAGNEIGSNIARGLMTKAIDNEKIGTFSLVNEGGSQGDGLNFQLDVNEVQSFVAGSSSSLNNKTLGFGMTFMHEALHTDLLYGEPHGSESYTWGQTGRIVNTMNSIRKQLGSDYGQRLSYLAFNEGGASFLPFDNENKNYIY